MDIENIISIESSVVVASHFLATEKYMNISSKNQTMLHGHCVKSDELAFFSKSQRITFLLTQEKDALIHQFAIQSFHLS